MNHNDDEPLRTFKLEINIEGRLLEDPLLGRYELARMIASAANQVSAGEKTAGFLEDGNGHRHGTFWIEED